MGLSDREEKQVRALLRRKNREDEGRFLAEGLRVVEDLLDSEIATDWIALASSVGDTERGARLLASLERQGIPRRIVPEARFHQLAPTDHSQGVLAVARIPESTWDALPQAGEGSVLLLLDGIQDPGNLGTLVRTTEALGAVGVVALPGTVDPWNPKSVRSAAGSSFRVPILTSTWAEASGWMKGRGYRALAAEAGGDPVSRGMGRVGLVVGNEGAGISSEIRTSVDGSIGIPLRGRADSLNVAAAAAILLYELTR